MDKSIIILYFIIIIVKIVKEEAKVMLEINRL